MRVFKDLVVLLLVDNFNEQLFKIRELKIVVGILK
jgi:hypothetical protein